MESLVNGSAIVRRGYEMGDRGPSFTGATACPHPMLAVTTAIIDSNSTMVTNWSEATGWVRHAVILAASDK